MSAWSVSHRHIDVIVTALIAARIPCIEHEDCREHASLGIACLASRPTEIGRILWRENYRSVNSLYGERKRPPQYVFGAVDVDAVTAIKQIHCLSYQSCEHEGWERSTAKAYLDALSAAIGGEWERVTNTAAYNAAPWGA